MSTTVTGLLRTRQAPSTTFLTAFRDLLDGHVCQTTTTRRRRIHTSRLRSTETTGCADRCAPRPDLSPSKESHHYTGLSHVSSQPRARTTARKQSWPPQHARSYATGHGGDDRQQSRRTLSTAAPAQQLAVTKVDEELESVVADSRRGGQDEKATKEAPDLTPDGPFTKHASYDGRFQDRFIHSGGAVVDTLVSDLAGLLGKDVVDFEQVVKTYDAIPRPRVRYIDDTLLTDLLATVRQTLVKSRERKMFYFTIMDDMVQSNVKLGIRDFNSAMVWVGKSHGVNKKEGLQKALSIFRKMEQYKHYRADIVTFNTLGDLALVAGDLHTTEQVLGWIKERELRPDRYTHMLKIRYFGRKGSLPGIKEAYRAMIASGELVDAIALNCLISSFLQANDLLTAEKVFTKMKSIDGAKTNAVLHSTDWLSQRRLGHILRFSAHELRNHGHLKSQVQDRTPIAPNAHTYRLLIEHHADVTGNLDRIMQLLADMLQQGLQITAPIFHVIFLGFQRHGTTRFSSWRLWSLRHVYDLFVFNGEWMKSAGSSVIDDRVNEAKYVQGLDVRLVEAVIRAFAVYQSPALTRSVWGRIQEFWTPDDGVKEELDRLAGARRRVVDGEEGLGLQDEPVRWRGGGSN